MSSNLSKLESIISTLGFYEFCTIEKDRDIYKINDILENKVDRTVFMG